MFIYNLVKIILVVSMAVIGAGYGWLTCEPAWLGPLLAGLAASLTYHPWFDKIAIGMIAWLAFLWKASGGYLADRCQPAKLWYLLRIGNFLGRAVWNTGCLLSLVGFGVWAALNHGQLAQPLALEWGRLWLVAMIKATGIILVIRFGNYLRVSRTVSQLSGEYELIRGVFEGYFSARALVSLGRTIILAVTVTVVVGFLLTGYYLSRSPLPIALTCFALGSYWGILTSQIMASALLASSLAGIWYTLAHHWIHLPEGDVSARMNSVNRLLAMPVSANTEPGETDHRWRLVQLIEALAGLPRLEGFAPHTDQIQNRSAEDQPVRRSVDRLAFLPHYPGPNPRV